MERVGTLINKLKEQFEQQADAGKLATTAQLLLAELQQRQEATPTGKKVCVVLPQVVRSEITVQDIKKETPPVATDEKRPQWLFDAALPEIPTLTHQEPVKKEKREQVQQPIFAELNHSLAMNAQSLNDKLKEDRVEVMAALQDTPVRDLKKAIGINDRYLFLNDLFRGDETMYERSIKTINAFTIYPEAQYWIQRELKIKLSWSDESETVQLFNQLIRRRFA